MSKGRFDVLDCPVDALTMNEALDWCVSACRDIGSTRILLTANALHLVNMQADPELRKACLAADLVTPDGMSIVWAGRALGYRFPERVPGVDLLEGLLNLSTQHELRIFILGAKREVLERFI